MTITVDPDPAIEGQTATITVDGPGPYQWGVFGEGWQELHVDPETNQAQVVVPSGSGGGTLVVSDHALPAPDNATVPIDSSD